MALNLKITPIIKSLVPDDAWVPGERHPSSSSSSKGEDEEPVFWEGKRDGYNLRGNGSTKREKCYYCPAVTELSYDIEVGSDSRNHKECASICRTCWWKYQEIHSRNKIRDHELGLDEYFNNNRSLVSCQGGYGPTCRAHRCYFSMIKAIEELVKEKQEHGIIKKMPPSPGFNNNNNSIIIGSLLNDISEDDDYLLTRNYLSLLT